MTTVLKMNCLFLLLYPRYGYGNAAYINVVIVILALLMLFSRRLMTTSLFWYSLFILMGVVISQQWYRLDNHKYLIAYWMLSCGLALNTSEPAAVMRWSAQRLIGLAFAFATVQKILGGEYLNGSFFHAAFLTDSRFKTLAAVCGGLSRDALNENTEILQHLKLFPGEGASGLFNSSIALGTTALIISYWTLIIEGLVAVVFLVGKGKYWIHLRNISLIVFLVTTYFAAPIYGFAIILTILGFAQTPSDLRFLRFSYFLVFILLQFIQIVPNLNALLLEGG